MSVVSSVPCLEEPLAGKRSLSYQVLKNCLQKMIMEKTCKAQICSCCKCSLHFLPHPPTKKRKNKGGKVTMSVMHRVWTNLIWPLLYVLKNCLRKTGLFCILKNCMQKINLLCTIYQRTACRKQVVVGPRYYYCYYYHYYTKARQELKSLRKCWLGRNGK